MRSTIPCGLGGGKYLPAIIVVGQLIRCSHSAWSLFATFAQYRRAFITLWITQQARTTYPVSAGQELPAFFTLKTNVASAEGNDCHAWISDFIRIIFGILKIIVTK